MDPALLRVYAAQKSQEHQVLKLVLSKQTAVAQVSQIYAVALAELSRKENWRWCPYEGLQVAIPQNSGVKWKARESVDDIKNRVRSTTLSNGDPDPNADRTLFRQDFAWTLAQVLHYGLGFATTRRDAAALIAQALLEGSLEQPAELLERGQLLKAEFQAQQSLHGSNPPQEAAAAGEVIPVDRNEGDNGSHREELYSNSTASEQEVQTLSGVPHLAEKARGKQREASPDSAEEDISHSHIEAEEYAGPYDSPRELLPNVSVTPSPLSHLVQDLKQRQSSQGGKTDNNNLASAKADWSWLGKFPDRLFKSNNTQGKRAASPVLQVIGEGKAQGNTNWLPTNFPLPRWFWGGPSTQPTYPSNDKRDNTSPADEGEDDAMIFNDVPEDHAPFSNDTTMGRLKRRRVNPTSDISTSTNVRSQFSIRPSKSPTRPRQPLRSTPGVPSYVNNAFPAAKVSTGRTFGKAKPSPVDFVVMSSIDKSANGAQNKEDARKRPRKKQKKHRLSSKEIDAAEADESLPESFGGTGLSLSKTACRSLNSSGNPTDSASETAPTPANVQSTAKSKRAKKVVTKKTYAIEVNDSKTGEPANRTLKDLVKTTPIPGANPANSKSSKKSVMTKKKSGMEPATAPGLNCDLHIPPVSDETQIPPQILATGLVSPPSSSEVETLPTHPTRRKKKSEPDKPTQGLIHMTTQDVDDECDRIISKLRVFNEWRRKNLPLYEEKSTSLAPRKKRTYAAAFEEDGQVAKKTKKPKKPMKNKQETENLTIPEESVVDESPSVEIEANVDVVACETNHEVPPKTIAPGTAVYHGKRTRYVLDCDESGVPAPRPVFRRSPGCSKRIRDQLGKPIDPRDVIRNEPRLDLILAKDPETLKKEAMANGVLRRRGDIPDHSPPRSGKILQLMTESKGKGKGKGKGRGKAKGKGKGKGKDKGVAKTKTKETGKSRGKGAFHKHYRSSKMPMRKLLTGGLR